MKKILFALLIAGALAACNVTITPPGPQAGIPVTVGDGNGASATIAAGAAKRFELTVAGDPVRLDVYHSGATADKELYVKVLDKTDNPYAHTDNRTFFQDAGVALQSLNGITAQDINTDLPYSINLPKNMGKVYVEVSNKTAVAVNVTVKAVVRNEVVRENFELTSPPSGQAITTYGAILFLKQHDTYTYTGADNQRVTFNTPDGANPVAIKAVLNKGTQNEILLDPGTPITLLNGDTIEVFSDQDSRAGFCTTSVDPACSDGIDSGEYTLTIAP